MKLKSLMLAAALLPAFAAAETIYWTANIPASTLVAMKNGKSTCAGDRTALWVPDTEEDSVTGCWSVKDELIISTFKFGIIALPMDHYEKRKLKPEGLF